jgi:hypothetical protein
MNMPGSTLVKYVTQAPCERKVRVVCRAVAVRSGRMQCHVQLMEGFIEEGCLPTLPQATQVVAFPLGIKIRIKRMTYPPQLTVSLSNHGGQVRSVLFPESQVF